MRRVFDKKNVFRKKPDVNLQKKNKNRQKKSKKRIFVQNPAFLSKNGFFTVEFQENTKIITIS